MKLKTVAEACLWLPGFEPEATAQQIQEVIGDSVNPTITPRARVRTVLEKDVVLAPPKAVWPRLDTSLHARLDGPVSKFEANVAAIKLLRQLEAEGRDATASEREALNLYTGWGGLPQAFNADQTSDTWKARSESLMGLLSGAEYASAHGSTTNAHYTPIEVVDAMWKAVEHLGFKGGRVLDPATGVGYFLGAMPKAMAQVSTVTAVELDTISSRIAKQLYKPFGVRVESMGFEAAKLPKDFYDLVISNVPFGAMKAAEVRNVPFANFSIHNYFFARALEVVRPGGLVAFITSSYTLDANGGEVREYLASKSDLVGAIRLPETTFNKMADTSVTTDIIILRKKDKQDKQAIESACKWTGVMALPRASAINGNPYYSSTPMIVNEHYCANPQWVVGKLEMKSAAYRNSVVCTLQGNLAEELDKRIAMLPTAIYTPSMALKVSEKRQREPVIQMDGSNRDGLIVIDGKLFEVQSNEAKPYKASGKALERILGLIQIRDAARKVIAAQIRSSDDGMLSVYRTALSVSYDTFVKEYGVLSLRANRLAFKDDPDLPLLLSLELWDEDTQTAEKAAIFTRRTVGAHRSVERCETAKEALQVCLAEAGRVVPLRIASLLEQQEGEVMHELEQSGQVYLDPETQAWVVEDAYLSGNVRAKLEAALASGERYKRNVEALEKVIPTDLTPADIAARIGSTWIASHYYSEFLDELLGCEGETYSRHSVEFNASVGTWNMTIPHSATYSVAATQTYGTGRAGASSLVEMALNQQEPTVYDRKGDKSVANPVQTIAAREKQYLLKEKFVQWLWSNEKRASTLVRQYNDQFNCYVTRRYNGEHLVLPGFSQAYTLRPHQRDAIWRVISSDSNTLLAHAVGAGKTLELICSVMELRRTGKANKPLITIPNHMLHQFASDFMRAYPGANILMATKEDLQGDKRRVMLSRIATGDWDAVIITHASFERIPMGAEYMERYIEAEISQIKATLRARAGGGRSNRIVKQLARAQKSWEARLKKLSGANKKDDTLTFDELGIDWIAADEGHLFKNLWKFTKMDRIAGLPNTDSQRAFDMFVKTRYVMASRGDGTGVTFATGTSISNSMGELWVMQRYLQEEDLHFADVLNFDAWASNFGEAVTSLELAPDGSGYRLQTRFAKFVNLPELMKLFREVADIRTAEMLDLPVPKHRVHTIVAKASETLSEYVKKLVERSEKVKGGGSKTSKDNMLCITNDGRKAALDMRMIDELAFDEEGSKINLCAQKVHQEWLDSAHIKGTQIIFCDLSTPRSDGRFSAYDDMRTKLVGLGIPEEQIAFIHDYETDAQKAWLFAAVKSGAIRIVMGSTSKLGIGTNVQTRLVAVHHLDAPWRPSDVEQRDGRILRQGNLNAEVRIYRYVTEGSFDSYIWQGLETKARFIAQVMGGDTSIRSMEDAELAALSYAEVKALASGNPLVLEKAGVDAELLKLSMVHTQWERQRWSNKHEMLELPRTIANAKQRHERLVADLATRNANSHGTFVMKIGTLPCENEALAAKALEKRLQALPRNSGPTQVGLYCGMGLNAERLVDGSLEVWLAGEMDYAAKSVASAKAIVTNLVFSLARLEDDIKHTLFAIEDMEQRLVDLKAESQRPFEKQGRLEFLQKRKLELDASLDLNRGDLSAVDETEQSEEAVVA